MSIIWALPSVATNSPGITHVHQRAAYIPEATTRTSRVLLAAENPRIMSISWALPSVAAESTSIMSIRRARFQPSKQTPAGFQPNILGISVAFPSVATKSPSNHEHQPGFAFHRKQRKHWSDFAGDVATENASIMSISSALPPVDTRTPSIMSISWALPSLSPRKAQAL